MDMVKEHCLRNYEGKAYGNCIRYEHLIPATS
jgi:hypothetical protein